MAEPSTLTTWAAAIAAALQARGIDAGLLVQQAGLDPALLGKAGARYPTRGMTRFWELAVRATDASLPLEVPRYVQPQTMHVLGLSLRASRTLGEAMLRMTRYSRLVTDAADIAIELDGDELALVYRPPARDLQLADAAYVAFMATAVDMGRLMTGPRYRLRRCEFRHRAPPDPTIDARFFDCPVRYGAAHNRLVFDRHLFDVPLRGADEAAARHYDAVAGAYLSRFDQHPTAQRVREWLIHALPSGEPTREAVADAMHLTPRTLLRRLALEDTHWKQLLNEVRRELALSYLRQGHSAAEITYLLGFGDPGNFTRAFRRWTGETPSAWRQHHRLNTSSDTPAPRRIVGARR